MAVTPVRILGIDASLRSTGLAVAEASGSRLQALEYGNVRSKASLPLSECLRRIYSGVDELIQRARPSAVAIESAFFHRNARTALILGEARGTAIVACAAHGLPVYEYEPRRVKQAVVGYGGAGKDQVRMMVMSLMGLAEPPQEDASDALAIAICHLHNNTRHAALMPREI